MGYIDDINIADALSSYKRSVLETYQSRYIGCITIEQQQQGIDILYKRTYNAGVSKELTSVISCLENCYEYFLKKNASFINSCYMKSDFQDVRRFADLCLKKLENIAEKIEIE